MASAGAERQRWLEDTSQDLSCNKFKDSPTFGSFIRVRGVIIQITKVQVYFYGCNMIDEIYACTNIQLKD